MGVTCISLKVGEELHFEYIVRYISIESDSEEVQENVLTLNLGYLGSRSMGVKQVKVKVIQGTHPNLDDSDRALVVFYMRAL